MNWILEHFQIVLALAGAVAYWLKQRASESGDDDSEVQKKIAEREAHEKRIKEQIYGQDAEAAERTRRVQEEIRRRREQREAGAPVPQQPPMLRSERPLASPVMAPRPVAESIKRPRLKPVHAASPSEAEIRRQEELAQKMRDLEAAKRAAQFRAKELAAIEASKAESAPPVAPGDLVGELRDPRGLRRAIILREVLGAPLALR